MSAPIAVGLFAPYSGLAALIHGHGWDSLAGVA